MRRISGIRKLTAMELSLELSDMRISGYQRIVFAVLLMLLLTINSCGSSTSRISIHDRFRVSSDKIITDIVTGLQWKVGPDRDFDWYGAGIWIEQLEGNWRMPLRNELEELFEAGITVDRWGPFDNTGWFVWSVDYTSRNMSFAFCFIPMDAFQGIYPTWPAGQRVFAVLSPPGYWINALRTFRSLNLCGSLVSLRYSE